ncbi:NAD(P)H-dependent oxidoreductase [Trinickia sp. Y13]|uniref:NADPH-dependent FMN reductase n=1 Tax=Trinickia sp. Y13 TaxID=2917807 RepID=UPI0032164B1F
MAGDLVERGGVRVTQIETTRRVKALVPFHQHAPHVVSMRFRRYAMLTIAFHSMARGNFMPAPYKVAVLVGSLRKKSFNRMLANALSELARPELSLDIVEIGALPFYNDDLEADAPAPWLAVRERLAAADAVLFVTPEYNRSVPAVLKNAVDVLSRPFGSSVLRGKPAAVVSASPGAMGGFGASHHLRQSLVCLGVNVMASPEAYVGNVTALFDDNGALNHAATTEFLKRFVGAFHAWIARLSKS